MSSINIVSYNVENGVHPDQIIENSKKLVKSKRTILCLQEVRKIQNREYIGDLIINALGNEWKLIEFLDEIDPQYSLGLAVIYKQSDVQVESIEKIILPKPNTRGRHYTRGALYVTCKVDDSIIQICNSHLDWAGGHQHRLNQLKVCKEKFNPKMNKYILCGDLNTISDKKNGEKQLAEIMQLFDKYKNAHPELPYTQIWGISGDPLLKVFYFLQKIIKLCKITIKQKTDYILYSGCSLRHAEFHDLHGSDHFPISAEFELN